MSMTAHIPDGTVISHILGWVDGWVWMDVIGPARCTLSDDYMPICISLVLHSIYYAGPIFYNCRTEFNSSGLLKRFSIGRWSFENIVFNMLWSLY